MINIRPSVFETNSSSSHSLAFSKKERGWSSDLPVDENGVLTIPFGEFGWGPAILRTPIEKLSYLVTDNGGYCYDDDEKSWESILEEVMDSDFIQNVIAIVKQQCPKVKEVVFSPASSFYPRGYIDHDSVGTSKGVSPAELIFNNDIIIVVDNDNSCHFYDYTHDHTNQNKIEELFDKSDEELEAHHWSDWF